MIAVTVYTWVTSCNTWGFEMVALLNPRAGSHNQSTASGTSTEADRYSASVLQTAKSGPASTEKTGKTVMVISSV